MDRFHAIQVFVNVAGCGGFAAAARDLAMSPPAVNRCKRTASRPASTLYT